ncbi:MAG: glycosyltransferase family 1 protein [Candidatus Moraniibacteriota bacterium]
MKIAIDCADLDYERIDGTRVYIKNLLDEMGKINKKDEFVLYHQRNFNPALAPRLFDNYKEKKSNYPFWWTQTGFGFELRWDKPDVCWMPIQQAPFLAPKEAKLIVTIHDLAFKVFPESFPWKDRKKLDFFTETAVKRADKIIAVSKSTKRDILKYYPKIKESKIEVVYHGVSKDNFSKKNTPEKEDNLLEKFDLKNKKYLLYTGAIQPRKNIETLVAAFEEIKKLNNFEDLKLVIVGREAWKYEKTLQRIYQSETKNDIIIARDVSFEDLAIFYQKAEVFVQPSLYEGFGLTVLEAFVSGTPAVVADNSSLGEISGGGALKFSALDKEDLKNKILSIFNNRDLRNGLIKKGLERGDEFSWEECARETLKIFKE